VVNYWTTCSGETCRGSVATTSREPVTCYCCQHPLQFERASMPLDKGIWEMVMTHKNNPKWNMEPIGTFNGRDLWLRDFEYEGNRLIYKEGDVTYVLDIVLN
jgi:hypothetical protein